MPVGPHESSAEEDYRESDDDDFDPNGVNVSASSESDSETGELDVGPVESGIRPRSQRAVGANSEFKTSTSSGVDVDALWKEFNAPDASKKQAMTSNPSGASMTSALPVKSASLSMRTADSSVLAEEYVNIERTFKFAGRVTTESKRVLKSSAEGQAFLRQQKEEAALALAKEQEALSEGPAAAAKPKRRPGPVKRKFTLREELERGKVRKLTTLQKSQLDWSGYVDKEGINDDLKQHNKSGYLDRQSFLARTDSQRDEQFRANRQESQR